MSSFQPSHGMPLSGKSFSVVSAESFVIIRLRCCPHNESIAAFNSEWVRFLIQRFQKDTVLTQHLTSLQ